MELFQLVCLFLMFVAMLGFSIGQDLVSKAKKEKDTYNLIEGYLVIVMSSISFPVYLISALTI